MSLVGVRILVSSLTLDQGGKAWARVEGLGNDENPFSFCGALYPLTITWSLGGHGIIELTSPLGVCFKYMFVILLSFLRQKFNNCFAWHNNPYINLGLCFRVDLKLFPSLN